MLGQWLDEALSPYESSTTTPPPPQRPKVEGLGGGETKRQREVSVGSGGSPSFVPDKMEPEGVRLFYASYFFFLFLYIQSDFD